MIARLVLFVSCYALALLQRPGVAAADTKIDLHVDPVGFLADVASVWSSSTSLGHVQSGQYGGYLFPMGPFHALGHLAGLAPWLVHRLWLGTLYALAAWGVVKLLDALLERERGVAHWVAAAAYVLNPYVLTYTSRVSVTLLAYAALPWLLLCVHRGLCEERRRWAWPAAMALIVTASGGGVNAAVTAFALLAPLLLLLYEPATGLVSWRAARGFAWRAALLGLVTSLWWLLPLIVQAGYGLPFLQYTEQSGTIWDTTSLSESLRGMGFWLSYAGVGYGGRLSAYTSDAHVLIFSAPVLVATLLVPALALGGFASTRRWRYGPFFLLLALLGALVMFAGFPDGTPLRKALTFAYNRAGIVQFLRTTYKAGPLVALGVAVLLGVAVRARPRWLVAGVAVLLVAGSWPLWRGRAVDDQLAFKVPGAWRLAARDLDDHLGDDARAMVLPGQLFAHYTWGGTVDPILPSLTDKPVAVRTVVPFADLRAVDLQWTTDALISQQRGLPGQLKPLLELQGVGAVVTGADDDRARSGAVGAAEAERALEGQGLLNPDRTWGPVRRVGAAAGSLHRPVALPQVRRYSTPRGAGLVQVLPRDGGLVVDGSADALASLAAFGTRLDGAPLRYAADLDAAQIRAAARSGATIVISDANRRRVFVPSKRRGNFGATLAAGDPISADGHQLDPWPSRGTGVQTVAVLRGVRYIRAPFSPQVTQFPEHRPFAALDGDPRTAWLADRALDADRWYLDVGLDRARDVPYLDLLPYGDARGRVKAVEVNGTRFRVHDGWNRLPVRLHDVDRVRVQMVDVTNPPAPLTGGAGGIRELRIPGVRASEALRVPADAERALRGTRAPVEYLFSRTRGDDPGRRGRPTGPWQAGLVRDQGDGETGLQRLFAPPSARRWDADAWVSIAPGAPDDALDRLAGLRGGPTSSGRYEAVPARRASSAFDGSARTAWIGDWGNGPAWIAWRTPRPRTLRTLRLVDAPVRVRRAVTVRLVADGHAGPVVRVGTHGRVRLPAPVRGRDFRLDVVSAAFPPGTRGLDRQRRAVGIAEIRGAGARFAPRRDGRIAAGCAVRMRVAGRAVALRPAGSLAALDDGVPLRARMCGAALPLPAGAVRLSAPAGRVFRADELRLRSGAPVAVTGATPPTRVIPHVSDRQFRRAIEILRRELLHHPNGLLGRGLGNVFPRPVISAGRPGRGRRDNARVRVRGPSWLVLGESYNRGWRARCDGRDLGAPVPIQGYANGWPLGRSCRDLDFAFAPQRIATAGYAISALAALALLVLLLVRRPRTRTAPEPDAPDGPEPAPWPWRRALAAGALAALAGGFVFAIRAGVVIGPLVVVILRSGLGPRRLALAAGALLGVVVPILYLAIPVHDHGGYGTAVPIERLAAHWVAVGAVVLLLASLARELSARRQGAGAPAGAGPAPAHRPPPRTGAPGPASRTTSARTSPR